MGIFVDRITVPHTDKSADDNLNDFLTLPNQQNVVAVQHIGALYEDAQACLEMRPCSEVYMLTRTLP